MARRAAALGTIALAFAAGASAAQINAGKLAPSWKARTVAGKPISSAQFKGKIVLLNFFSYG